MTKRKRIQTDFVSISVHFFIKSILNLGTKSTVGDIT